MNTRAYIPMDFLNDHEHSLRNCHGSMNRYCGGISACHSIFVNWMSYIV